MKDAIKRAINYRDDYMFLVFRASDYFLEQEKQYYYPASFQCFAHNSELRDLLLANAVAFDFNMKEDNIIFATINLRKLKLFALKNENKLRDLAEMQAKLMFDSFVSECDFQQSYFAERIALTKAEEEFDKKYNIDYLTEIVYRLIKTIERLTEMKLIAIALHDAPLAS